MRKKVGAYQRGLHSLALPTNIRLEWKLTIVTNALAYNSDRRKKIIGHVLGLQVDFSQKIAAAITNQTKAVIVAPQHSTQ